MELSILLRNCSHGLDNSSSGGTHNEATGTTLSGSGKTRQVRTRYALKCDTFSVQIAKTPIQVPIPQQAPELIDIGFYRPSLSISGIVDTVGQNTSNNVEFFENMEYIDVTRNKWTNASTYTGITNRYYIPYKNALEDAVYRWITTEDVKLELEVGDTNFPMFGKTAEPNSFATSGNALYSWELSPSNNETGGGIYVVAIQQARFQVDPATEDRWQFQIQMVCESRKDVAFVEA